jgi:hypothetical protein
MIWGHRAAASVNIHDAAIAPLQRGELTAT